MSLSEEQMFIRQLKQAYVKAVLEIGDKSKEVRRLEKRIDELEKELAAKSAHEVQQHQDESRLSL